MNTNRKIVRFTLLALSALILQSFKACNDEDRMICFQNRTNETIYVFTETGSQRDISQIGSNLYFSRPWEFTEIHPDSVGLIHCRSIYLERYGLQVVVIGPKTLDKYSEEELKDNSYRDSCFFVTYPQLENMNCMIEYKAE